ncbi:Calx-beta domain-containing protein [Novosphingobium aerophilum]|nr:Calx-beta domain-containing protein [Novosphingobium aerophilum]
MQINQLQYFVATGQFDRAYFFIKIQIENDPRWDPRISRWLDMASNINRRGLTAPGSPLEGSVIREFVWRMNNLASLQQNGRPVSSAQNQAVSNNLARTVVADYLKALETGVPFTADHLRNRDVGGAVAGLKVSDSSWADGVLGIVYGFDMFGFNNTPGVFKSPSEVRSWIANAKQVLAGIVQDTSVWDLGLSGFNQGGFDLMTAFGFLARNLDKVPAESRQDVADFIVDTRRIFWSDNGNAGLDGATQGPIFDFWSGLDGNTTSVELLKRPAAIMSSLSYPDLKTKELPGLPEGILVRSDGIFIDKKTGRKVEVQFKYNEDGTVKTRLVNGINVPIVDQIFDVNRNALILKRFDDNNRLISSDIGIAGNPLPFDFSDIGSALGQQLGYRLANGDALTGVLYSAVFQTLGDNLGVVLDGLVGKVSVNDAVDIAFAATGGELLRNLKSAGIGAVSSFLTAQLVSALGLNGFAGGLVSSAAGTYMSAIIAALPQVLANPAKIVDVLKGVNVGNVIGGFLGSNLAAQIVTFDTIGGQLGAAVGSALAAGAMTAALAAATPTGLAATFANMGWFGGPLGVAVAAFVGFLVGGLIGSIFGGTPRSGADASWDASQNKFVVSNVWARKGGSQDAARGLASAAAETFNAVLSAVGGMLLNPAAVTAGNYGMRKSDYVYQAQSSQDQNYISFRVSSKDKDAYSRIVGYGVVQGLTDPDFQIAGGDIYVKRAIYNTFALGVDATRFDTNVLIGNISSAQSYESYLANAAVINALVSAEPDSAMATETLINLARADELGLTRRAASDWFGGFTFLLKQAGATAADTTFGFDYDPASGQVSRLIGIGAYSLIDTVDIAGQTTIKATAAAETIDLRTARLADQRGYTVDGKLNNDIAVAGSDFTTLTQTVTFAAGEMRKSVNVTVTKDTLAEAAETLVGTLSNGTGLSIVGGSAEATLVDGTAALPTLLVGRSFAREGDGYAVFRVSLSKAATGAVSASLAVLDDTTTVGVDRGAGIEVSDDGVTWTAATALTFAAGQVQKFVRVAVLADNVANPDYVAPTTDPLTGATIPGNGKPQFLNVEGNERFTLSATVTAGASLIANVADANGVVSARGTGTILDATTGTLPLAWIDAVTLDEASGQATFSIARSSGAGTGSLTFATADRKELAIDVAATVDAGDGNDLVYASNLGDNLFGGAGNDTLYGGRLDDWLLGGEGDDVLDAGGPDAGALGGDGNYLNGGAGNDVLRGREGSDWLEGGEGADTLTGGGGDDILAGGAGDGDQLAGGAGNDQYVVRRGDGLDTINDEAVGAPVAATTGGDAISQRFAGIANGTIRADWAGTWGGVVNDNAAGGEDAVVFGAGIEIGDIQLKRSGTAAAPGNDLIIMVMQTVNGVESFSGTQLTIRDWFANPFKRVEWLRFADGTELRLGDLSTFITGTAGNDVLIGTAGNDFVFGGAGNDKLFLLAGDDVGNGGTGDDMVAGDVGRDLLIGGLGNDEMIGGRGNDVLSGDAGADDLYGGAGDQAAKFGNFAKFTRVRHVKNLACGRGYRRLQRAARSVAEPGWVGKRAACAWRIAMQPRKIANTIR